MAEYISREAAIETIRSLYPSAPLVKLNVEKWHEKNKAYMECETAIERIPTADVRPVVRGKWIDRDDDYYGWNMWACSACGEEFVLTEGTPDMNEYHFCPNCGADMREET